QAMRSRIASKSLTLQRVLVRCPKSPDAPLAYVVICRPVADVWNLSGVVYFLRGQCTGTVKMSQDKRDLGVAHKLLSNDHGLIGSCLVITTDKLIAHLCARPLVQFLNAQFSASEDHLAVVCLRSGKWPR